MSLPSKKPAKPESESSNKPEWSGSGPLPDAALEALCEQELKDIRKNVWQRSKGEAEPKSESPPGAADSQKGPEKPKEEKRPPGVLTKVQEVQKHQRETLRRLYEEFFPSGSSRRHLTFKYMFDLFCVASWSMVGVFFITAGASILLIFDLLKVPATVYYMRMPNLKKTKFRRAWERHKWTWVKIRDLFYYAADRVIKIHTSKEKFVKVVATVVSLMILIVTLDMSVADHRPILPGLLAYDYLWPIVNLPTLAAIIHLAPAISIPGFS